MLTIGRSIDLPIIYPGYYPHSITHRFLPDDQVEALIRLINYRVIDGQLQLKETKCRSILVRLTGDRAKEEWNSNIVEVNYNVAIYGTAWEGPEGFHFADGKHVFVTVPQLNRTGMPKMFTAHLGDKLERFMALEGGKNWMPFKHEDQWFVITSLTPPRFKSITAVNDIECHLTTVDLTGYEGHSNGCRLTDEKYLFLVTTKERQHRWMLLDMDTKVVKCSDIFSLVEDSKYEYISSLIVEGDSLWIGVGIDYKVKLLKLDLASISLL